MPFHQHLTRARRRQPALDQPIADLSGPKRRRVGCKGNAADGNEAAFAEIPQQHETGGLAHAGLLGKPVQLVTRDRLGRIREDDAHLLGHRRMRRAALHDQIGAEIAERHGRKIGKGAAQDIERDDQRDGQRDAADQQRAALPAIGHLALHIAPMDDRARRMLFPQRRIYRRLEIGLRPCAVKAERIVGLGRKILELDCRAIRPLEVVAAVDQQQDGNMAFQADAP